jgi:LPS-assembly lipoprotein
MTGGLRGLWLGAAAALMLVVSACGFTPLYGEAATVGLSRVAVETPDTRLGYRLRERLEDALLYDRALAPEWRLDVTLEPSRRPLGRRIDDTAARYEMTLLGQWTLTPLSGGEALAGRETVTVTYAVSDQPYAAIAAQDDAEERAAEALAQRIRLALFHAVGPTAPARP